MYKVGRLVVCVVVLGMTLSAAASQGTEKPYAGVVLTYAAQQTPALVEATKRFGEFEGETGIKIKLDLMDYDSLVERITIDCLSNTKNYDCFWIEPPWLGRFEWEFEPLEKYINDPILGKGADISDIPESLLDMFRYKGKLLGLPFESCMLLLGYRKDLLEQYGLSVPETYGEYKTAIERLHNLPETYGLSFMGKRGNPLFCEYNNLLWPFGGDWFGDGYKPTINSPEAVEALKFLISLKQYAPPGVLNYGWEESATTFIQGKTAFAAMFTDWVPALEDPESSKVIGKWNFTLIPRKVKNVQQSGMVGEGINADISQKKKEAAWLFIKWLTGKEVTLELTRARTLGPSRTSVIEALKDDPKLFYMDAIGESLKTARVYGMKIPEFFELNDVLTARLSQALAGEKTPQEALDIAQSEWERILKEAGYF